MKKIKERFIRLGLRFYFGSMSKVFPEHTAKKAFQIFSRKPLRHHPKEIDHDLIKNAKMLTEFIDGLTVYGYSFGSGSKVIILAHGYNSHALAMRKIIRKLIANDFTVIAFDAPAHGKSDGKMLTNILYIKFLVQIYKKYKPYGIIGHSIGGICALFAVMEANMGADIAKKVLISSPTSSYQITAQFSRYLKLNNKSGKKFHNMVSDSFVKNGWELYSIEKLCPQGIHFSGLILHDKNDNVISHSSLSELSAVWPLAKSITTYGLGHSNIIKDEATVKQICDYIME